MEEVVMEEVVTAGVARVGVEAEAATEGRAAMLVAMAAATAAPTVAVATTQIQAVDRHCKQWRNPEETPRGNSPD